MYIVILIKQCVRSYTTQNYSVIGNKLSTKYGQCVTAVHVKLQ